MNAQLNRRGVSQTRRAEDLEMANPDRNLQDVVSQELNDSRSELNQATAPAETELEAARRKRALEEVSELQLNCWSGGGNKVSSACWDGNRVARLQALRLRSPRRCAQRQRSRLRARAAAFPLIETGDYLIN
jgi:hypothetical protein